MNNGLNLVTFYGHSGPGTIDIDIVLFDETPLNTEFWEYAFVAVPLAELIPDFEHPVRHEKLIRVAEQLQGGVVSASPAPLEPGPHLLTVTARGVVVAVPVLVSRARVVVAAEGGPRALWAVDRTTGAPGCGRS